MSTCPSCGYCPHCGRRNPQPYSPTWQWYPNGQWYPNVISGTGIVGGNTLTPNFSSGVSSGVQAQGQNR